MQLNDQFATDSHKKGEIATCRVTITYFPDQLQEIPKALRFHYVICHVLKAGPWKYLHTKAVGVQKHRRLVTYISQMCDLNQPNAKADKQIFEQVWQ